MGFNQNSPRAEYIASSGQVEFPYAFKVFKTSDIKVYLTPSGQLANDTNDILILGNDYTVTINEDEGGTITLLSGAALNDRITLLRDLPVDREVEYQTNGDLLASTLNQDQNYQTYLMGDVQQKLDRFIRLPNSVQELDLQLPAPTADTYLKWNATGTNLENDTTAPTWVQAAADSATAAQTAQTGAETAQTAAETAQTGAETAETNASTSETNAASSATAAALSATSAATSATASASSATDSANSAIASASSATSAATSATTATTQAGIATTQASNASNSATAASNSASAASTSETNAANSATSASTSATSAATTLAIFQGQYTSSVTEPTSPDIGDLWTDENTNTMKYYNGTSWVAVSPDLSGIDAYLGSLITETLI